MNLPDQALDAIVSVLLAEAERLARETPQDPDEAGAGAA
jgi:hypothetical protein